MSLPTPNAPKPRDQRWVHASIGLATADKWLVQNRGLTSNVELVVLLQGLGRMDVELINDALVAAENVNTQRTSPQTLSSTQILQPARHIYQSFLWVLAAYEFIRTLDQICTQDSTVYSSALSQDIKQFKHGIERVRIPLAKLETAVRYLSDFPMAYPGWVNQKEVGWQVGPSTIITRIDLSNELLSLVEKL
jgi:hypothetical protein